MAQWHTATQIRRKWNEDRELRLRPACHSPVPQKWHTGPLASPTAFRISMEQSYFRPESPEYSRGFAALQGVKFVIRPLGACADSGSAAVPEGSPRLPAFLPVPQEPLPSIPQAERGKLQVARTFFRSFLGWVLRGWNAVNDSRPPQLPETIPPPDPTRSVPCALRDRSTRFLLGIATVGRQNREDGAMSCEFAG